MANQKNLVAKIAELDELVKYFESANEDFDLEAGLAKYASAMELVKAVKTELESYELKIKEVEAKFQDAENED